MTRTTITGTNYASSSTLSALSLFGRFFLGLLNGMTVVFPTVVAEICGKEHEVRGMSLVTSEPHAVSVKNHFYQQTGVSFLCDSRYPTLSCTGTCLDDQDNIENRYAGHVT